MNLRALTGRLTLDKHGIYRSQASGTVSYPPDGHDKCFMLEDSSFWFQHRNSCINSVIKRYPPTGPIIDVGGGNGYVTRGILDAGFDTVLLEPGPEGALNGKLARNIPTVICSTFSDAGFEQASLNAVGCFDVIEHINDDRQFIEQIHSALKPGGLFYVAVPASKWLWSQSDVAGQHYRRYNKAMAEQLLSDRFELLYFSYLFSILTLPILLFRALPFRLGLSRDKNVLSKSTEHGTNKGIGTRFLNWRLIKELSKIEKEKTMRFGTSCLFVARKSD